MKFSEKLFNVDIDLNHFGPMLNIFIELLRICKKNGAKTFEMDFTANRSEDIERNIHLTSTQFIYLQGIEQFINPKLVPETLVSRKDYEDASGGLINGKRVSFPGIFYLLRGPLTEDFINWYESHDLYSTFTFRLTLFNEKGVEMAFFRSSRLWLCFLTKSDVEHIESLIKKYRLKPLNYFVKEQSKIEIGTA